MKTPLIAGNWKMFKNLKETKQYIDEFKTLLSSKKTNREICICGPYTDLFLLKAMCRKIDVKIGAQNVFFEKEGAYTGEISAEMLKEIRMNYCIVGHSERRQIFKETDEEINKKVVALLGSEITPILCVGETYDQRQANGQFEVVTSQIESDLHGLSKKEIEEIVIAYEPIWAIGTGLTASKEQADEMCKVIRDVIGKIAGEDTKEKARILYGGSVKPENATEIMSMPNVDGVLVGGASLKPDQFMEIVNY